MKIGWGSELHSPVQGLRNIGGTPGISEPMPMSDIARVLYYGDGYVPSRPFFDDIFEAHREEIFTALVNLPRKEAGRRIRDILASEIRDGYYRERIPNGQLTIKLKESDVPLIDTGELVEHLRSE